MLYPQVNRCRSVLDLSGFWQIRVDRKDSGESEKWFDGFAAEAEVGVPGSWNEQLAELGLMFYVGTVWYQKSFFLPSTPEGKQVWLRIGSADFRAKVWLNGQPAGGHEGGFLPFEFDVTGLLSGDRENRLVIMVNNTLSHETIPQGVTPKDFQEFGISRSETYPPTNFDFLPYGGIHRPVKIYILDESHVRNISLKTHIHASAGKVDFQVDLHGSSPSGDLAVRILDGEKEIAAESIRIGSSHLEGDLRIENCCFWSPQTPHLYTMLVEWRKAGNLVDEYRIPLGIREITVKEDRLLLNGKPIFLRGFGKHEDFAVLGKGLSHAVIAKDFELMKWIGANSFRTSHYPYSEEIMYMADRQGFLVIDEVPAVSLNMARVNKKTLEYHKRMLTELIQRDRNHPSVIMWSIGNEPGLWGEKEAVSPGAERYWRTIYEFAKQLDSTRPVTLPLCAELGGLDPGMKYCDVISINRYWGWYQVPARLDTAGEKLREELQNYHDLFKKPILVSEFGADAIEGSHATFPQLFTEEYQKDLILKYFEVIESLPFTVGEHIWNFADFRTAQNHRRVILNKKGIFNRQREPKSAAFAIRKHWLSDRFSDK